MIRAYQPRDLEATVFLFQRSVRDVASSDYSPEQIAAWAPEPPDWDAWARRLETGGVFVYERDDRVLGFTRVDGTGSLDLLFVHPGAQRQGIARALLGRALRWAAEQGIRSLRSDVSVTARPFFESAGFHVVRKQTVERQGVWFDNFRMERFIDVA